MPSSPRRSLDSTDDPPVCACNPFSFDPPTGPVARADENIQGIQLFAIRPPPFSGRELIRSAGRDERHPGGGENPGFLKRLRRIPVFTPSRGVTLAMVKSELDQSPFKRTWEVREKRGPFWFGDHVTISCSGPAFRRMFDEVQRGGVHHPVQNAFQHFALDGGLV